ncbi:MAG: hypothetical protein AAF449_04725 [Myxococcota bacterium]
MRTLDVVRMAKMAPALQNLVLFSMPDGRLVEHWPPSVGDADSLATVVGDLLNVADRATRWGFQTSPKMIAVESEAGPLIVCPISEDLGAGFFFNATTNLGLARIQIRDMMLQLEPLRNESKPPAAVPLNSPPSGPPSVARPDSTRPLLSRPDSTRPTATRSESIRSESSRPELSRPTAGRSRGVMLLDTLQRHAPDPHICLLRLSLRTGIALEKLDSPEQLTPEQVDAIATAVRDIIGRDDLGA